MVVKSPRKISLDKKSPHLRWMIKMDGYWRFSIYIGVRSCQRWAVWIGGLLQTYIPNGPNLIFEFRDVLSTHQRYGQDRTHTNQVIYIYVIYFSCLESGKLFIYLTSISSKIHSISIIRHTSRYSFSRFFFLHCRSLLLKS